MKNQLSSCAHRAIAALILFVLVACADAYVGDAEEYVRKNAPVQKQVGEVTSLTRINTTIVRPGDQTVGYREYQFIVRGSVSKAVVHVRVDSPDAPPARRTFSVTSVDKL